MVEEQSRAVAGAAAAPSDERRFVCTHPGCSKRFTRAEHLQRHALNHTAGTSTCSRCSAHFKRPDLLERHMNRHRQKDQEAGGEGYGVLDTRKRAWKAPDGTLVEKRPHPSDRAKASRGLSEGSASSNRSSGPQAVPQNQNQKSIQSLQISTHIELPTSPISDTGSDKRRSSSQQHDIEIDVSLVESSQANNTQVSPFMLGQPGLAVSYNETWIDPSIASLPQIGLSDAWQLSYEQPFQPDTASSFNMPYTTALDYNWLFDMNGATQNRDRNDIREPGGFPQVFDQSQKDATLHQTQAGFVMTPESHSSAQQWTEAMEAASQSQVDEPQSQGYEALEPESRPQPVSRMLETRPQSGSEANYTPPPRRIDRLSSLPRRGSPMVAHQVGIYEPERPLSILIRPARLPQLDEDTREQLLSTVEAAKPCLPDQRHTIQDHPLLALDSLQTYLDLYFTRFNTAYPIIHAATFDPSTADTLLLLSVLLLGATYSVKDAHQLAVCIHDVIRPGIFAHAGFSARPELWMLQTILLVECFGKSRAGQKQHDMSHLFHGLLINLIRRSDFQSARPRPPTQADSSSTNALDTAWRKWAENEQKKRLTLYCFMWDTQHAVLFCQSLCMSAFELRLHFPCSQAVWEAPDAGSWAAAWRSSPFAPQPDPAQQPFYLPTLKAYLTPGVSPPTTLNAHARVLVLHGLMSIAWDMQRRDQTALGVVSRGPGSRWRELLAAAYDAWKTDFDEYCVGATQQWPHQQLGDEEDASAAEDAQAEFVAFAAAAKAVYHAAQSLLRMDFLDVQIYAGARHILGRPVQQRDYLHSAQVIKRWAATAVAEESQGTVDRRVGDVRSGAIGAAWHAARMLRDVVPVADSEAMSSLFHVPWCLYLATLTCWAFHHASPSRGRVPLNDEDEMGVDELDADEMVWDLKGEMDSLISDMAESPDGPLQLVQKQRKRRTNGLVWLMADILTKVRWGIVHSGVMVLRGLVPMRIINQYETEE
ncbi:hypothetical protein GQ53DRAFT_792267 [Thozetella sp. PMI_491]|nr:hypothetical protein GQ53DRAFT_792267 [Thozetella sp. PMI_491]